MFEQLKKTYQGKKVFVTGHTGFKGSWLVETLYLLGATVKGYALSPENETDLFNLINGDSKCQSVIADIRDSERVSEELLAFQPDFVFHLAAQPLVRLSYETPAYTFEVNGIGTAHLLDAVRKLDKKCAVILITTDKVYHNREWEFPYRENDRLGGFDPYSASKACAEIIIDSYRNSFFNLLNYSSHQKSIAVGRAGNVIGGGDWAKDRILPDIARALAVNEPVLVRNPFSVRPWQHVLEPVVAYLQMGVKMDESPELYSKAYNIGPDIEDALSVEQLVSIAIEEWGRGEFRILSDSGQPHEAGLLKLDTSRARKELGWRPKLNARQAVALTAKWYNSFYTARTGIDELTKNQILDFLNG